MTGMGKDLPVDEQQADRQAAGYRARQGRGARPASSPERGCRRSGAGGGRRRALEGHRAKPDLAEAHNNLGIVLRKQEKFAGALGREAHDLTALNDDLEGMLALVDLLDDHVSVSNLNVQLRAARGRASRALAAAWPAD